MCCRYLLLRAHLNEMLERLGLCGPSDLASRYNIAPGTRIPAVRKRPRAEMKELVTLRWGLVPAWAKGADVGAGLINARAESLADKPAFREAFRARRCLIPASGFYEWKTVGRAKQPWLFQLSNEQPFFLAGLWETWTAPDGGQLETCTVVTTAPNKLMQPIHHRMPAILPVDAGVSWLEPLTQPEGRGAKCLRPFPAAQMIARPVSQRVNSVANDDAGCLAGPERDVAAGDGQLAWDL